MYYQICHHAVRPAVVVPLTTPHIDWLYQIADHLYNLFYIQSVPHTDERFLIPFQCLLSEINYLLKNHDLVKSNYSDPRIMHVLEYIKEHLSQKITMQDIASYVHIGKTKLCTDFCKYTSMSVYNYIVRERLALAQKYLVQGCSVDEVAQLSGFSDSSHFIKTFRKHFNTTPTQYRESQKEI
jgi:AraC-like DNA-binding protein